MATVALYVRVSRAEQNPQLQHDECDRIAAARGWTDVRVYEDHGVSGARDRRPALDRLLADARQGQVQVILVWRTDRLFRSLRHMVTTIDELSAVGVAFVSATEPFDTTTPQGRLLLHLVSAFAEFERQVNVERTRAGMDAARRRGARIGRPRVYVDVARALRLRAGGWSQRRIAVSLGVSQASIGRALRAAALPDEPQGVS